jgi:hypothetical protein
MSQEHDTTSPHPVLVTGEIRTEAPPFEPGYQPETLPHISVPDLPDDAQGLSADALAQVPTLTDWVDEPAVVGFEDEPLASLNGADPADAASADLIQDVPTQADTWGEELQVRMGKLTDEIHTLNARLDRLEERNNTKV